MNFNSPETIIVYLVIGAGLTLALAFFFLRHFTIRALAKLDHAVTRDDIRDVVRENQLKVAMLELEREIRDEIKVTRHDMRNEMQGAVASLTTQVVAANKTLSDLEKSTARIEGVISGTPIKA